MSSHEPASDVESEADIEDTGTVGNVGDEGTIEDDDSELIVDSSLLGDEAIGVSRGLHWIASWYYNGEPPFEAMETPEIDTLRSVTSIAKSRGEDPREARARVLTFGSALDYARPADRHWGKMETFYNDHAEVFDAGDVVEMDQSELVSLFEQHGIRFWEKDAGIWRDIATSLDDEFDGDVVELVSYAGNDAIRLVDYLQSTKSGSYPYLQGPKIAPMYARFIHENVQSLSRVSHLSIPVDVQIDRVTCALAPWIEDRATGRDDRYRLIRIYWRTLAFLFDLPVHRIDGAIWEFGRNWDTWGQDYLAKIFSITGAVETADRVSSTELNIDEIPTARTRAEYVRSRY